MLTSKQKFLSRQKASGDWIRSLVAGVLLVMCGVVPAAGQELRKTASWESPDLETLHQWIAEWGQDAGVDIQKDQRQLESNINQHPDGALGAVLDVIAKVYPQCQSAVEVLRQPADFSGNWQQQTKLESIHALALPDSVQHQLLLATGSWLARHQRYDEALQVLQNIPLDLVVDPAALLFYRATCQHHLLQMDDCGASVDQLLEQKESIPRRFSVVANLMKGDVETFKKDSLDEISRMMDDAARRQGLHRSGTEVITLEKDIIAKLEKLIEETEEKLQQQQQASSQSQPGSQQQQQGQSQSNPSSPMQDSQNASGKGDGRVVDKGLKNGGDWGNLPPQEREAVLTEMAKDLPPHYREVIEEYFRKLANEPKRPNR